jgi:hypothetical protein
MTALDLDFRRQQRRTSRTGVFVLAFGLASSVAIGMEHQRLSAELAVVADAMPHSGDAIRKPATPVASAGESKDLARKIDRAREVYQQIEVPWNDLFTSVETANTTSVALLSIESDTDNRRILISGEAKDIGGVLDYARALGNQGKFSDVYLQSHELQQQDPQHPVHFVMGANWPVRK